MNIVECLDRLQFDNHSVVYHQVSRVVPDDNTVVPDRYILLLLDIKTGLRQFVN